nr:LysR substrate-binding domain-containing protein [Bacteroides acidifaciens]
MIGTEPIDAVDKYYREDHADVTEPDGMAETLRMMQQGVAMFTWLKVIPTLDAQHGTAGRGKHLGENEEKQSLSGVFRLGVLPTIAPYLLPRFFPQLMEKYPELDIRVTEMKTQDVQQALHAGDLDAGIIASKLEDTFLTEETLFYEQFYAYVSKKEPSFKHDLIRTSDITGERLWLLDEGHCFRDQLVRFCQMEAVKVNQMAYRLGSMETFMRMVESGKGITFIPELAVSQLTEEQRKLVRPFAIPRPTRQVVLATSKDFVRHSLLCVLKEEIKAAVPKEMLSLQSIQCLL